MHLFMYILKTKMIYNCFIQSNFHSRILNSWKTGKLRSWGFMECPGDVLDILSARCHL